MLLLFTSTNDFLGLVASLWLMLYLIGRGFPSRVTVRAVVILLTTAVFFFAAFGNLYVHIPNAGLTGDILLTIGLAVWCDLTNLIFLPPGHRGGRRLVGVSYAFALITVLLLLATPAAFVDVAGRELWVARIDFSLPSIVHAAFLFFAGLVIFYNVRAAVEVRRNGQSRYFLATTFAVFNLVGLAMLLPVFGPPVPRLVEDGLVFISVILLGISVARHQTLVERRITARDFLISALATIGLASIYIWIAWQWSHSAIAVLLVGVLAILTHATYDLVREFLGLLRRQTESRFRAQLHRLEHDLDSDHSLQDQLQKGIELLCRVLGAGEGFIAVRQEGAFQIVASYRSLQTGSTRSLSELSSEDIFEPPDGFAERIAWLAPAFGGGGQLAVIGLGHSRTRFHYSSDDLDLLAEAADRVGTIVHLSRLQPHKMETLLRIMSDAETQRETLRTQSNQLMATLTSSPDPEFIQMVEDSLRHLSDFVTLGQYPLSQGLGVGGETHIERGKALQQRLIQAIEGLRPETLRPAQPLPREWHSYVVLHDAYIDHVPNRDIMARLYISEGTFNRTRRKALRGVARYLLEKKEPAAPG